MVLKRRALAGRHSGKIGVACDNALETCIKEYEFIAMSVHSSSHELVHHSIVRHMSRLDCPHLVSSGCILNFVFTFSDGLRYVASQKLST